MTDSLLDHALAARRAGLNVVPPREDGTKAPEGFWAEWQTKMTTEDDLVRWYGNGRTGIGIVCGAISGGLELLEFEGRAVDGGILDDFLDAADASGIGALVNRVTLGYSERTPSGGIHLLFRCPSPVTTKLATSPEGVLIETKGEGGFVITAPSCGKVHPTGRPWELLAGGFATITTLSAEEQADLHRLARTFGRSPRRTVEPRKARHYDEGESPWEVLPGDDFNARATWAEILEPHHWRRLFTTRSGNEHWCRPGKEAGTSATVSEGGEGVLYVFTSSTCFEPDSSYSKFGALAVLEHGGDYKAAAEVLEERGYGKRRERQKADSRRGDAATGTVSPEPAPQSPAAAVRRGVPLIWGNQVQPRALRWLWPSRIATGKVSIFEGDPGLGKSLVSVDITARLTRGAALPGCEEAGPPRRVLIASAEDTVDDVILPRLVAAGARVDMVAFHRLARDPDTGKIVPLTIPRDLDRLANTVADHDIPFVVLDPLVAFLGEEIRSHVDASVRQAMGPLSIMAEETGAAIAGLRHLNKSTSEDNPLYRGGGSIAFGAAARSVLLFARHRDDAGLFVVAQVKTNLSAPGTASSLGYRIEASPGPYGEQPTVAWLAEPLGISAAELLQRGGRDEAPKRSEAEGFLLDVLADGPVAVEEIRTLAQGAGFSWRTVERAKGSAEVCVERRRDGHGKTVGWCWRLPVVDVDEAF